MPVHIAIKQCNIIEIVNRIIDGYLIMAAAECSYDIRRTSLKSILSCMQSSYLAR